MKNTILEPYDFDSRYEFETYIHIGGEFNNLNRKKGRGGKYRLCNTYSEWERYVKRKLPRNIQNYNDFIHWLEEQRRESENFYETIKSFLIPIYIAIFTTIPTFIFKYFDYSSGIMFLIIVLAIITFISAILLKRYFTKTYFWRDYINIAKK